MFNKLRLQHKLMLTIMIVFFALLLAFIIYLYTYMKTALLDTELAGLIPTTQKVSDQVDTLYKQIDYAALGFTSNQENLDVMVNLSSNTITNPDDSYVALAKLAHNLNAVYNVVNDLYKVIVFIPDRDIFYSYFRNDNLVDHVPRIYTDTSQASSLFQTDPLFTAFPPHPDVWSTVPENIISVVRRFSTPYNTNFGMVEIQLPYKSLKQIATLENQSAEKTIYIFDKTGQLIFPLAPDMDRQYTNVTQQLSQHIQHRTLTNGSIRLDGQSRLISTYTSSYLQWTTVIVDNGDMLQQNLEQYRYRLMLIGLTILIAVLIIYYAAIRKVMMPLLTLIRTIRSVNINNLSMNAPLEEKHDFDEVIILHRAFERMIERLRASINTEYESKIRSIEANYSALQAQINPHFLYNTLNVIAVHCEETDSMVAADMCYRLSEMMRYSGSSSGSTVRLADELKYSVYYIELLQLHYDQSLFYELDIPDRMLDLHVPKLTLQPFIENAINHGLDKKLPPWNISIRGGYEDSGNWYIRIEDNGIGIDLNKLEELRSKIARYRENFMDGKLLANLQVSGMGILNTYARLLTQFGASFYFHISNGDPVGYHIEFGVLTRSAKGVNEL